MDGVVWAKEFCRLNPGFDEELAVSWFCNAIMCGYDHKHHRLWPRIVRIVHHAMRYRQELRAEKYSHAIEKKAHDVTWGLRRLNLAKIDTLTQELAKAKADYDELKFRMEGLEK